MLRIYSFHFLPVLCAACLHIGLLQGAMADEAPVTWPKDWKVLEEKDDAGNTFWMASPEVSQNSSLTLTISRISIPEAETKKEREDVFKTMLPREYSDDDLTVTCSEIIKTQLGAIDALETACAVSFLEDEDTESVEKEEGPVKQVLAGTIVKSDYYTFIFSGVDSEVDKAMPVWEEFKKSLTLKP